MRVARAGEREQGRAEQEQVVLPAILSSQHTQQQEILGAEMLALRMRQSSHYLSHLDPTPPVGNGAEAGPGGLAKTPDAGVLLFQAMGGQSGGKEDEKAQEEGGGAKVWQDAGPGVLVHVEHPRAEETAAEENKGDGDEGAVAEEEPEATRGTSTKFVGTLIKEKQKAAKLAAQKAQQGREVHTLPRMRCRHYGSADRALCCQHATQALAKARHCGG